MIQRALPSLTTISAIGAGIAGGVFFAFSTFVMPALRRLPAEGGISAMQAINVAAPNPLFMAVLFGTGVICAIVGVAALARPHEPGAMWRVAGALLYVACLVLTAAYHVPKNDALALVDPHSAGAARAWAQYTSGWTAWNHVRALTSIAGGVSLFVATRASDRAVQRGIVPAGIRPASIATGGSRLLELLGR